jgi:hypothetical protein
MKKYLINYADKSHYASQKHNVKTGLEIGGFDKAIPYTRFSLGDKFCEKNKHILDSPRGAGYWLWKPYIIFKTLEKLEEDDILFYSDAGIEFIKSVDELIPIMDSTEQKILAFQLDNIHPNKRWTKRDCFVNLGVDEEKYANHTQFLGSYIIMRKTNFVVSFVKEWLSYAEDYRNITDSPNECGLPNYPEFVDHRHDQSIYSLLVLKNGIKYIRDISQYGKGEWETSQILNHHRSKQ